MSKKRARTSKKQVAVEPSDKAMTLVEHLIELKRRVLIVLGVWLIAVCVCYFYSQQIYQFLVHPLADIYAGQDRRLIYTGLTEAFFTYLQLAMFAGFVITFPVFAFQLYFFLAPGLYKHERAFLLPVLTLSPILFLMGAALVYYFVFPVAWRFFSGFETLGVPGSMPIQLEARVSEYLSLVTTLIIAFGLAFQLPVALMLLAKVGVVTPELLKKSRRYAIVLIFIVAGVLTPPDVISQIGLAIPLLILYEFSIFLCRYVQTNKK
ncbi:MAG: twin-arginine translocase subunit TatC [Proteobacteria bacterium]|nr:twin-arginine translocase subunit TatC [Pseudomonadota bacterium]